MWLYTSRRTRRMGVGLHKTRRFTYYSITKCHGQARNENLNIITHFYSSTIRDLRGFWLHPCEASVTSSQLSSSTLNTPELALVSKATPSCSRHQLCRVFPRMFHWFGCSVHVCWSTDCSKSYSANLSISTSSILAYSSVVPRPYIPAATALAIFSVSSNFWVVDNQRFCYLTISMSY